MLSILLAKCSVHFVEYRRNGIFILWQRKFPYASLGSLSSRMLRSGSRTSDKYLIPFRGILHVRVLPWFVSCKHKGLLCEPCPRCPIGHTKIHENQLMKRDAFHSMCVTFSLAGGSKHRCPHGLLDTLAACGSQRSTQRETHGSQPVIFRHVALRTVSMSSPLRRLLLRHQ